MKEGIGAFGNRHIQFKLALFTIIFVCIALLLYKTELYRVFISRHHLISFLESLGAWGGVGLIALQALQVLIAPIPGEVTGLLGGYVYGPYLGVLLSTIGLTMGSYLAFALSKALGRPFVKKLVPASTLKRFDYLLHHKGAFFVFLLFLIPGIPKDYLCYILGLGSLSTTEFLVIGGTGRLLGTILLSVGGYYIRLQQYAKFTILIAVALLFLCWAYACKDKLERWFRLWHIKRRRGKMPHSASRMATKA